MTPIRLIVLLFGFIVTVNGSHFLGGTITWHPLNVSATGTPVAIVITQTYSWSYSLITCTTANIASSQLIPVGPYSYLLTQTLSCIANCSAGSAGYVAPSVRPYCTDISAPVGITVGQRSDIVYLQVGDDFSVAFQQTAWRALVTAPSAAWSISTHIQIIPRSDNGLYNNAPVSTMMSPINIPLNQTFVINVPVADADGDITRCRWATSSNGVDECGGVCPPGSLPPGTIIYPNCTIIITGSIVGDWFAVTLMVEDFISPSSTTPLSSVTVQFLVDVVSPPSCPTPPDVVGIPVEQSCTSVQVGQTFTSELIAINNCGSNVTIVDIATLSFAGMAQGNIIQLNTTIYYKNLSWTPTAAQLGYQVMCAMAFDSQNAQSAQYCFTFYVSQNGVCACPGDVCITTTTTTSTTSATSTTIVTTTRSNYETLALEISLGLGLPLLLLLGTLLLCCLCKCCFGPLGPVLRRRYGDRTKKLSSQLPTCNDPKVMRANDNSKSKPPKTDCNYREQYINDGSTDSYWSATARQEQDFLSFHESITDDSSAPLELCPWAVTITSLVTPSIKNMPNDHFEHISLQSRSPPPTPVKQHGSILVQAYSRQQQDLCETRL